MSERPYARKMSYSESQGDNYPTCAWETLSLIEKEEFTGTIWDSACGSGSICRTFKRKGFKVIGSDIRTEGLWKEAKGGIDFISTEFKPVSNIVINPPFSMMNHFIKKSLHLITKKLCVLGMITLLSSSGRKDIYDKYPPKVFYVFSKRPQHFQEKHWYDGTVKIKGGGTRDFCWAVWDKDYVGPTRVEFIGDKWFNVVGSHAPDLPGLL